MAAKIARDGGELTVDVPKWLWQAIAAVSGIVLSGAIAWAVWVTHALSEATADAARVDQRTTAIEDGLGRIESKVDQLFAPRVMHTRDADGSDDPP